ncbi:MAG: hypothetical protein ACRDSZ_10905 [Pseudonocardiaceae bacterium]
MRHPSGAVACPHSGVVRDFARKGCRTWRRKLHTAAGTVKQTRQRPDGRRAAG